MGNYCCSEQEEYAKTAKKKIGSQFSDTKSINSKARRDSPTFKLFPSSKSSINSSGIVNVLQILSEIGKGGQANVYKIKSQRSFLQRIYDPQKCEKNLYALKKIKKPKNREERNSIKMGSSLLLSHECSFIAKSFCQGESEHYIYEIMQIAQGGDLSSFLERTTGKGDQFRKTGQLGVKLIVSGIVLGLQYLHKRKMIYQDLKVQNILIGHDGYPLLCDCHLICNKEQKLERVCGSITYLSPEALRNETPTSGTDLWALGVLIYMLVYDELPYETEEVLDEDYEHECRKRQNRYFLRRKKASDDVINLINSLLKVNPSERIGYKSIGEIKKHCYFRDWDWQKYENKEIDNPLASIISKFPLKPRRLSEASDQYEEQDVFVINTRVNKDPSDRKTKCDNVNTSQQY